MKYYWLKFNWHQCGNKNTDYLSAHLLGVIRQKCVKRVKIVTSFTVQKLWLFYVFRHN